MKNTIIFRIDVDEEDSYGTLANFIYKREHHLGFSDEEVRFVTYRYYLENSYERFNEWAQIVLLDGHKFTEIREPSKVKNITEKYEVIYCLRVGRDADIVNIYNLFLIKHYYSKLKIFVLFEEDSDDYYYTISQFLYWVNRKYKDFYNACYFRSKDGVKRAQLKNISFSREFIPLQTVDSGNLRRLFQNVGDLLDKERLHRVLTEEKIEVVGEEGDLLNGAVKLLHDHRKDMSKIPEELLVRLILRMDVFSFILLCYVANVKSNIFSISELQEYAYKMQQYSGAIRQLAENIVFHSKTKFGVIAFRVHKRDSAYMEQQYKIPREVQKCNFLEIIVSDFCGDDLTENIAENFIANLEDYIREEFRNLCPRSFFTHTAGGDLEAAWEHFYQNPEHIGKHFGLRIFQSIVTAFEGLFGAESHKGYRNQKGDSFLSYEGKEHGDCMPGTRYHIVFQMEHVREVIKKQDFSLDSGINISANIKSLLDFRMGDMNIQWRNVLQQSQREKNEQIRQISKLVQESLRKDEYDIVYMSLEDAEESMGEIFAKALVMALYYIKRDLVIVLYQCTDNIKRSIYNTLRIFFQHSGIEGMFFGRKKQIVMYTKAFEETVIDLASAGNTDNINAYIAYIKCISITERCVGTEGINIEKGANSYIPCDSLWEVGISGKRQTLFEHYAEMVLSRNIQKPDFGCKLEHTHMRLGSTIHIDQFYEAEILFGNKLFVSRFALLLVKDMREKIEDIEKLTLYGYGTYSETVLVRMVEMIRNYYPDKDVDYIILEREEERRGFLHKDRIRYNQPFEKKEERIEYFKERKIVTVVLINSTLKTHVRLINLFKEENDGKMGDGIWPLQNYAVLLVGNDKGNQYWSLIEDKRVELSNGRIYPEPRYFIQLSVEYQEPMQCDYCFPKNPMAEIPLIEVNAASTIPNQAFGVIGETTEKAVKIDKSWIQREEEKMKCLKGRFIYGHVQRNENHFLYYFKTEEIWVRERKAIRKSLDVWRERYNVVDGTQYHIIVAPMHYSNAGFVELVNDVVFGGNAILLRIDFDKEYRCNAHTKFSYLRSYVEQLCSVKEDGIICVHYVDDVIISGRTFHRAKSLIESVLEVNGKKREPIEIRIFEKVFVLVDRNSAESRMQYVQCGEDFYSFVHVNISSLRNYGDSCVFCNLKKEADLLCDTASTSPIAGYWEGCSNKFKLYTLEGYDERQKELEKQPGLLKKKPDNERTFRRLFCTHMAQCVLEEKNHGNDKVQAMYLILNLLNTDYESRSQDKFEYFLSYLKCISRPFLVFKKPVKEAIFDILLLLIDAIVRGRSLRDVIKETEKEKSYLAERRLIIEFNKINNNVLEDSGLTKEYKQDLVKLLMKQLTELKSNYIIRMDRMDAIFAFMKDVDQKEFEKYYISLIDRLVGASSDTNKSIWLDEQIEQVQLEHVSQSYREWILLENTRAFRDGIEKLYNNRESSDRFRELSDQRIEILKDKYDFYRSERMFEDFRRKNQSELDEYKNMEGGNSKREDSYHTKKRIQRFIRSLPELPVINFKDTAESLDEGDSNWAYIFEKEREMLGRELEFIKNSEEEKRTEEELQRLINDEFDIYQYGNFYKILEKDGYMSSQGVTSAGIDMIICCVKVLHLCRNRDTGILDKVRELAVLFRVILGAQKIQFIVEKKDDNYLGEWKRNIEERYNGIVKSWNEERGRNVPEIHIREEEHYAVIVEKSGLEDYNTEVSKTTEMLLNKMKRKEKEGKHHNYMIDRESGSVIWKLENKQRSVWVNIENDDWRADVGTDFKVVRDMRRVMIFYQELKREIFNPENDDYINEISHISRELSIYNSNKVYSHTKEFPQVMQFEQVLHYIKGGEEQEKYMNYYPYHVLNLLADINMSRYYRNGLQKNLHGDEMAIENPAAWKEFTDLLGDGKQFIYRSGREGGIAVQLRVRGIEDEARVLCRSGNPDFIREFKLLIYALILNAAERGRGKRQNQEKSVQTAMQCVIVELYREAGFLVLENECDEDVDMERIERSLSQVPESEEDGISLWSFHCYIKRCINSLIMARIKEMDFELAENQMEENRLYYLGEWIKKLTGEMCKIQAELAEKDGKAYFKLKLPIFMEQYHGTWTVKGEQNE